MPRFQLCHNKLGERRPVGLQPMAFAILPCGFRCVLERSRHWLVLSSIKPVETECLSSIKSDAWQSKTAGFKFPKAS